MRDVAKSIEVLPRSEAPEASQPTLDAIVEQLGFLPNVFGVAAHSPNTLASLWAQHSAVGKVLDEGLRHQIGLAIAQASSSPYCLAAHTYSARKFGMSEEEIELSRKGEAREARANAGICFAVAVAKNRGRGIERELDSLREAGYSNEELLDFLATTSYHLFTNFITNVLDADIDREFSQDEAIRHGP